MEQNIAEGEAQKSSREMEIWEENDGCQDDFSETFVVF